jgi:AAA ATPase domain
VDNVSRLERGAQAKCLCPPFIIETVVGGQALITLTKAQVFKYKSIENSSPVEIGDDVTVLVGKNESGKTAFLEALDKSLSLEDATFNFVFDYPRKDYVRYRPQHDAKSFAKVVDLTFRIEKDLADKINREVFHGAEIIKPGYSFTRTTNYGNENSIDFAIDLTAAIAALKKPFEGIEHSDEVFAGAKRLEDVLSKIEAKQLPADSTLAVFAKEWRGRTPQDGERVGIDIVAYLEYLPDRVPSALSLLRRLQASGGQDQS